MTADMKFDTIKSIIDFAIEKEQEAVDFYTDLAGKVKLKSIADELLKVANMEKGHKDKLQKMDLTAATSSAKSEAVNLKIADYLVEKRPEPDMQWQDLVQIAMQRELAAMNLYKNLAGLVEDGGVKQLLLNLSAEESEHKNYFEKIWDEEILTEN